MRPEKSKTAVAKSVQLKAVREALQSLSAEELEALPEAMREFADYRMLLYAIVLIIVMLATNNPTMKEFFHRIGPAELLRRAKKKRAKSLQKEGA